MGVTAVARGQVIPIDNFDDLNDDGWTHVDTTIGQPWGPGTFDASSGAYLLQGMGLSPSDNPTDGLLMSVWNMSIDPVFSSGFVRFKARVNQKNTSAFIAWNGDLATFTGHLFGVNTELDNFRFLIEERENFGSVSLLQEAGPIYEPDQEWMFEAGDIGDQLSLKYWKVGDAEPWAPQLTAPDTLGDVPPLITVGASFPGDHNPASLVSATFDDLVFERGVLAPLDIKPGSDPNSVNLKGKGVLPVAVLSTADFDASLIDPATVLFGDPTLVNDGGVAVSPLRWSYEDVNYDDVVDLSLKFSVSAMVGSDALGPLSESGLLTANLVDSAGGTRVVGSDLIRIVPLVEGEIPEPSSLLLILLGMVALTICRRR